MATKEMMKPSLTKKRKRSSSDSPPSPRPWSFSSLPYDLTLNCLARTSRTHAPILSLVCKSFRSIIASPYLETERSFIGKKPEKCLYVCLNLNNKPTWFILSTTHKQKLIPIPSFPYQHPNSSTVISNGSDIYLIGGFFEGKRQRSRRVFVLDCKSHQWRHLPKMHASRREPLARVIDGKICVFGGCSNKENEETYDPKTQTWEPLRLMTRINIKFQENTYPFGLAFENYHDWSRRGLIPKLCLVYLEKKKHWFHTSVLDGELVYSDSKGMWWWSRVSGLKGLSSNHLISVANVGEGSRVTVWWKKVEFGPRDRHYTKECFIKTEIWCAEI